MTSNMKNGNEIKEINFNGAAVIDQSGREIAITEDMIQDAFKKLEDLTVLPSHLIQR